MKTTFLILALAIFFTACSNQKAQTSANCYKGRLEITGICSNYTITLLDGNLDTSKVVANWTDENTGKQYKNAFALANPCSFPATLKAGDEFYFVLDDSSQQCTVCMAYYPKPTKALGIKVLEKGCN